MLANHSKSIKKITFNNPRASFNIRRHAGWCVGVGEEKMKTSSQQIWIVCPSVLFSSSCLVVSRRVNADADKKGMNS